MENKKQVISFVMNIVLVILGIVGLFVSIKDFGSSIFVFYTQNSNIFATVASCVFAVYTGLVLAKKIDKVPVWAVYFKYIATCCLVVTFMVVVCVLIPLAGLDSYHEKLFENSELFYHFLCPVINFITFMLVDEASILESKAKNYAVIPTLCYATIIVILNILKVVEGPYPFLKVYNQPAYMSVIWCAVIIGSAYLFAVLTYILKKKISK